MKIIKRSGMEDTFDIKKIEAAIRKAYETFSKCGRDSGYGGKPDHEPACIQCGT